MLSQRVLMCGYEQNLNQHYNNQMSMDVLIIQTF